MNDGFGLLLLAGGYISIRRILGNLPEILVLICHIDYN